MFSITFPVVGSIRLTSDAGPVVTVSPASNFRSQARRDQYSADRAVKTPVFMGRSFLGVRMPERGKWSLNTQTAGGQSRSRVFTRG